MGHLLTRDHLVGLGIAIGVVALVLLAVETFGPPIVAETNLHCQGRTACRGDEINPDADWGAWSAIGAGFAVVWISASYLALRSRDDS